MFTKKYTSLVESVTVNDPAADIKTSQKMGRYLNRHCSKKDMEGQQAHEKMLSIPDY